MLSSRKQKKKKTLSNSIYESKITWIVKSDKDSTNKNYRPVSLIDINTILANQVQQWIKIKEGKAGSIFKINQHNPHYQQYKEHKPHDHNSECRENI